MKRLVAIGLIGVVLVASPANGAHAWERVSAPQQSRYALVLSPGAAMADPTTGTIDGQVEGNLYSQGSASGRYWLNYSPSSVEVLDVRSGKRQLLPSSSDILWSPDSRNLAYVVNQSQELFLAGADGSTPRAVRLHKNGQPPVEAHVSLSSWLGSKSMLISVLTSSGLSRGFYIADRSGTVRPLESQLPEAVVRASPDGNVLFYSAVPDGGQFVADLDPKTGTSRSARPVSPTISTGLLSGPRWSSDGKRVAAAETGSGRLVICDTHLSGCQATTPEVKVDINDIYWSPDGSFLATTDSSTASYGGTPSHAVLIDPGTRAVRKVAGSPCATSCSAAGWANRSDLQRLHTTAPTTGGTTSATSAQDERAIYTAAVEEAARKDRRLRGVTADRSLEGADRVLVPLNRKQKRIGYGVFDYNPSARGDALSYQLLAWDTTISKLCKSYAASFPDSCK